jgi:chromosome partitioning protein
VGKSTLARLLARELAAQQWRVKIADLDLSQATSFQWRARRLASQMEPDVAVEQFGRLEQVLKMAEAYDLIVFDGAPHSSQATRALARASDLTVIPTGLAVDDLQPSVTLAHELVKAGVPRSQLVFALCRVGNSLSEMEDARAYLRQAGYPA